MTRQGYYRNIPIYIFEINEEFVLSGRNFLTDLWLGIVIWWDFTVCDTQEFHLEVSDNEVNEWELDEV